MRADIGFGAAVANSSVTLGEGIAESVIGTQALAVGIDSVDIERIDRAMTRNPGFVHRVFTGDEQRHCDGRARPSESYAARWAAKEAVVKCLGLSMVSNRPTDIEVGLHPDGAPWIRLHGPAQQAASALGVERWLVSLTHDQTNAAAVVVALGTSHG